MTEIISAVLLIFVLEGSIIASGWRGFDSAPQEQLRSLFGQANAAILELQKEKRTVMKSTAAVLAIEGDKAVWANSGDSRVYYFHKNKLAACTEDHSVAYKKYKAGEITRDMLGSDEEILIDLLKSNNSQQWAELMLIRAMERINNGNDNISIITVKVTK